MKSRSVLLGILVGLAWWLASLTGLLERASWAGYHQLFEWRGPLQAREKIVIIALDEPTMAEVTPWPPPRTVYAELLDGLFKAGAKVVAIDVMFAQPQSPLTDAALAAALRRHAGKVVLAANVQLGQGHEAQTTLVLPQPAFQAASNVGFVNFPFDADGAIHRYSTAMGTELASFDWQTAVALGRTGQPTQDARLINFAGRPGTYPRISLVSALDAIREGRLELLAGVQDAAVLVGATAIRLQDQYPTPLPARSTDGGVASYMPGVEIHANALNTLLLDNPIQPAPPWALGLVLVGLGACAGGLMALFPPAGGLGVLLAMVALAMGSSLALFNAGIWLDFVAPCGMLLTTFVAAVADHFRRAESARRFYRRTFERYVAKDIVDEVLRNPGLAPKLGGERREVTVLFSDIRSFTTISEQRTPEQVVEFLNAYLTAMAEVIHANQGCIDKYIGDAILALWGNVKPIPQEEAARLGVRTALMMKARVAEKQAEWAAAGFPHIEIGIGVNTGDAVVGNIGSPEKLEFGVIGDSINVASRLEGITKDYGGAVVISGRTRELLGDRFECTFLDRVKVKGRVAEVEIYSVEREL